MTKVDRDEIHILKRKGYSQTEIASRIKVSQQAISYELIEKTRKHRLYDATYARHKTYVRAHGKRIRGNTIALHPKLLETVEQYLLDDQSPEHTSKRILKYHKDLPYISGVSIRTYIKSPYGRRIEAHRNKIHHKRRGKKKKRYEQRF